MAGAEDSQDLPQPLADLLQLSTSHGRGSERQGRLLPADLRTQLLARSGNRKPLIIEEFLHTQNIFNICPAVHPLACSALAGLKLGKLGFPEPKDIARQPAETADFTDAEIELVGNLDFTGDGFP